MEITYQDVKSLVENKLINKSDKREFEDLSEYLFGEGNCYNSNEVRKRMYGMKRLIEIIEDNKSSVKVANRILSISDLHVPFNLPLDTFKQFTGKVDTLVLNGDIEDCQSCSKFPKKYRVDLNVEMVKTRDYLIELITMLSPKKVYVVMGNHEYRLGNYLTDNLKEDVMTLMRDSPMDYIINDGFEIEDRLNKTRTHYQSLASMFKEQGIDVSYEGNWFCKVGKTIFAHPLTYSSGMLKTTEKAVNFFLRTDRDFNSIVLGHTHQIGTFKQGDIRMYEQGCCCDLNRLDYNNGRLVIPGQNGCLYMCHDEDGNIIARETEIVEL